MHVSVWKGALYEKPFSFTKKGNGKNCEEKVGKSKAKVWEKKKKKTLILEPPVPSFLWGWGLPGLLQQQLYNVFLPLTDYISTLESIPFNYKQLLYLTKVSLTAAAARGPGFYRHMGEHKKINQITQVIAKSY